jgi:hypothetical protein
MSRSTHRDGPSQTVRGSHGEGEPPRRPRSRGSSSEASIGTMGICGSISLRRSPVSSRGLEIELRGFAEAIRGECCGLTSSNRDALSARRTGELSEEEVSRLSRVLKNWPYLRPSRAPRSVATRREEPDSSEAVGA